MIYKIVNEVVVTDFSAKTMVARLSNYCAKIMSVCWNKNVIVGTCIGIFFVLCISELLQNKHKIGELTSMEEQDDYSSAFYSSFLEDFTLNSPRNVTAYILQRVLKITKCNNRSLVPSIKQRGNFWVLYNYVKAEQEFLCHESITYTTQGDYTFLDNLVPLIDRWKGPISIALYAPGYDFQKSLDSIAYLRNCESPLIRNYVTFHIFFGSEHIPKEYNLPMKDLYADIYDCTQGAPYKNVAPEMLFKAKENLTYPINVARNVARETAQTHFVFASDIELYPTRNFIKKFLTMVAKHHTIFESTAPKVFALPIFEILENETVPESKSELQKMYKEERAFLFHSKICARCHAVPSGDEWMEAPETKDMDVFSVGKRLDKFKSWEAFYVGTHLDPLFDERMTWEGQSNKMTQGYALCLLDYDYMVLNNAFLIHKPGVKKKKVQMQKYSYLVKQTNQMIKNFLRHEYEILFGRRAGCKL